MARVAVVLLALVLCGCAGARGTPSTDDSRRFADYDGTRTPTLEQCALPVEERQGGWLCPEAE